MFKKATNQVHSALILLLVCGAQAMPPDTCKQETWAADGLVNAILPVGNKTYICGSFTCVGPYTGGGIALNTTTGTNNNFPKINGPVWAVCSDGNNGWYVGGSFTFVGGVSRNCVAHILSDGSVDANWNPNTGSSSNTVQAIALSGSSVFVGGHFSTIGGQTRANLACVDATTGNATAWNANTVGDVSTITVGGTWLYVGGPFSSIKGVVQNFIAKLYVATGNVYGWNPNPSGPVTLLVANGASVYVAGSFSGIGGQSRNRLACLDAATGNVTTWNPYVNNIVSAIAVNGTSIYIGGQFTSIGGQGISRLACVDSASANATTWNPNANGDVKSITVVGTTVFAGGSFSNIGGQNRSKIACLDATTGNATSWDPSANGNTNGDVYALIASGTSLYAGGNFTIVGGQQRNRIACLDATTGFATSWNPNASTTVNVLATNGASIYAGGGFTTIGGQSRNYIACLDTITGLATTWNPNASSGVLALAVNGASIYVGGAFTTIGGQARNRVACLDATTGLATSWNPNANANVNVLAANGTSMYAGGSFTTIGGQTRNFIACLDTITGLATAWNPNADSLVLHVVANGAEVYAGGRFTNVGGQSRNRLACLDAATGNATTWNPNANGWVYKLAISGSTVYAVGRFTTIGGQTRNYISSLDAVTGNATLWNPDANLNAYALALSGTTVYAGGIFTGQGAVGNGHPYFAQYGDFYSAPLVSSIAPSSAGNAGTVHVTNLNGTNYRSGATVRFVQEGQSDIIATNVNVVSSTQITCDMDLTGANFGTWDVIVSNNDVKSDTLLQGFVVLAAPSPPSPVSPANNAVDQLDSLLLVWHSSLSATSYALQVSGDSSFATTVINQSALPDTTHTVKNLMAHTTYYWKVSATNAGGTSAWSTKYHFTTANHAPIVVAIHDTTIKENDSLKITASATDPDGDALTYAWSVNGTAFSTGASLVIPTTYVDAGTKNVSVIVSDGSMTDTSAFVLSINNNNRAPVIHNTVDSVRTDDAGHAVFTISATDADGDAMTFFGVAGKTTNVDSVFSITLTVHGYDTLTLKTTDGMDTVSFKLRVYYPTGTATEKTSIPAITFCNNASPNPFNPSTTIRYGLTTPELVTITVHDIRGRAVATLINRKMVAGYYTVSWGADGIPSGFYFVSVRMGTFHKIIKTLLMK